MKLKELAVNEGLVDATILMTLQQITVGGISGMVHVTTLAKAFMAIQKGYTFSASNFNAYYNEFFPAKDMLDTLKALSKENAQQLASFVLNVLEAKNVQLASLPTFKNINDILVYATQAEAND